MSYGRKDTIGGKIQRWTVSLAALFPKKPIAVQWLRGRPFELREVRDNFTGAKRIRFAWFNDNGTRESEIYYSVSQALHRFGDWTK